MSIGSRILGLMAALNPLHFSYTTLAFGALGVFASANLGFFALSHYTTSEKQFCMSCHAQQSHSDFAKPSLVHPDTACPQCHAKASEIVPRGYYAETDPVSANCVRCHEDMPSRDDQAGFKFNALNVKIPHRLHVRDVGARCTDCHANIAHDPESPATNRPRMEGCYTCHARETTDCTKCHRTEAPRIAAGAYVSESDCTGCHAGFKSDNPKLLVVGLFHKKHVAHGIACQRCHGTGEKHGAPVLTRPACLGCHHSEAAKRVPCATCHEVEASYYAGNARGEKDPRPAKMKERVDCGDCHAAIATGHARDAVKKACAECHEGEPALVARMDEWQERGGARLRELSRRLAAAKEGLARIFGAARKDRLELIGRAEVLAGIVANDRSGGVHNAAYTEALAKEAEALLDEIERAAAAPGK